jgi:cupin-like protein
MSQTNIAVVDQAPVTEQARLTYFPYTTTPCPLFVDHVPDKPFLLTHSLHESEVFQLPALLEVAKRREKAGSYHFDCGDTVVGNTFVGTGEKTTLTLVDVMRNMATSKAWVGVKRLEQEPEYKSVLKQFSEELSCLTGTDLVAKYQDPIITVFLNSPGRVTPYHIDAEINFLLQVRGTKAFYCFDGNDRSILSVEEIEGFLTGDYNSAKHTDAKQAKAMRFDLAPGLGVFNPSLFPHWVHSGPEISISVSVNFKKRDHVDHDAFKMNRYLRKFGIHPTEPGRHRLVDRIKSLGFRVLSRAGINFYSQPE